MKNRAREVKQVTDEANVRGQRRGENKATEKVTVPWGKVVGRNPAAHSVL